MNLIQNLLKKLEGNLDMSKWFKDLIRMINMTPTERYLAQATDRYDLEQRQKNLALGKVNLF
jgi:hypothetical protein